MLWILIRGAEPWPVCELIPERFCVRSIFCRSASPRASSPRRVASRPTASPKSCGAPAMSAPTPPYGSVYFGTDPRFRLNLQVAYNLSKAEKSYSYKRIVPRSAA